MSDDTLSEILKAIRLRGAVFFDIDTTAPWVAEAMPSAEIALTVLPGAEHVIEYHVITGGSCWASLVSGAMPPVQLFPGDVIAFPQGDPHVLSSAPGMRGKPNPKDYRAPENSDPLPVLLNLDGGGEERGHFVCGFLGCDIHPFNPLLASLPRMLHVRASNTARSEWLKGFVRFAILETNEKRAGKSGMLAKLGELMFVELLRHYLESQPDGAPGLLRGMNDRQIGRALNLIHQRPAEIWSLEALARQAGMSRSSFSERFTRLVGISPMQYLQKWRLQVAASRLAETDVPIAVLAEEAGYDSEAAFSRAFKKITGTPPAEWRGRKMKKKAS